VTDSPTSANPVCGPILGIDTSTALGGVALVGHDGLLAEYSAEVRGAHGPRLMVAVERLLDDAGLALADLGGIGVSIGPGSFTGLRVGLATAMGLGRAADLPLFPVSTLESVAWAVPTPGGVPVAVAITARRNEVYGAVYHLTADPQGDRQVPVIEPCAMPPNDFFATLNALNTPLVLAGSGAASVLAGDNSSQICAAAPVFAQPRAAVVAWRAALLQQSGYSPPAEGLKPFYLTASQAEIAWAARQSGATP
jgi:tRNA threonylcarbamoyladenosine biosynthesis protein TsaB